MVDRCSLTIVKYNKTNLSTFLIVYFEMSESPYILTCQWLLAKSELVESINIRQNILFLVTTLLSLTFYNIIILHSLTINSQKKIN